MGTGPPCHPHGDVSMMGGAPAVVHGRARRGKGLKQLLLHRPQPCTQIGAFPSPRAPPLSSYNKVPPSLGGEKWVQEKDSSLPAPCSPLGTGGINRGNPSFPHAHAWTFPGGKGKREGQTLTFVQQQLLQGLPPLESFLWCRPAGEGLCVGKAVAAACHTLPPLPGGKILSSSSSITAGIGTHSTRAATGSGSARRKPLTFEWQEENLIYRGLAGQLWLGEHWKSSGQCPGAE